MIAEIDGKAVTIQPLPIPRDEPDATVRKLDGRLYVKISGWLSRPWDAHWISAPVKCGGNRKCLTDCQMAGSILVFRP